MKLKAGALAYAIFIAFLTFGLCSSFILYSHFQREIINDNHSQLKNLLDLKSAIELGLFNDHFLSYGEEKNVLLFPGENSQSVNISKERWGLYDLIHAKLLRKSIYKTKSVLTGSAESDYDHLALYLADRNSPLSLAGNTKISGPCYLPKSGLKKAYIEGQNFNGSLPSPNKGQQSKKHIPSANKERISQLEKLLDWNQADSILNLDLLNSTKLFNSWSNKTAAFQSHSDLKLKSLTIEGKFVIHSTKSITIENSTLNGVILVAPKVYIQNQIQGNYQIVATDSIVLEKGSTLLYPSSLSLIDQDDNKSFQPAIIIRDNSKVEGDVLLHSEKDRYKNQLLLNVDQTSSITGRAYVNGLVDLKGKINGALFCEGFILKTPSSIYSNHLLNATINRNTLPDNFISSSMFPSSNSQIVKWLN